MVAANVKIGETNGANPGTYWNNTNAGIDNSNFGSVDNHSINTTTNPITAGQNSFEKWQQFEVIAINDASAIKNFKVWYTGTLSGSDTLKYNGANTQSGYNTNKQTSYAATSPKGGTDVSTIAVNTMPTSAPTGGDGYGNLGYGGNLNGQMTATSQKTDYLVMQLHVDSATTTGATLTIYYQYDEVA